MKKPASKVAEPAQIQPKFQFLFYKNLPPQDFFIMTLLGPQPKLPCLFRDIVCNTKMNDYTKLGQILKSYFTIYKFSAHCLQLENDDYINVGLTIFRFT